MRSVLVLCFAIFVALGLGSPCRGAPCVEVPLSVEDCALASCCSPDLLSQLTVPATLSESCLHGSCDVSATTAADELPLPPAPQVLGVVSAGPLLYAILSLVDEGSSWHLSQPPWAQPLTPQQLLL